LSFAQKPGNGATTGKGIDAEDGWYNLGQVGQAIQASHPDFDTRTYGHSKLSALVAALTALETEKNGNRLVIRPKN